MSSLRVSLSCNLETVKRRRVQLKRSILFPEVVVAVVIVEVTTAVLEEESRTWWWLVIDLRRLILSSQRVRILRIGVMK
jgi:hypothetical protein